MSNESSRAPSSCTVGKSSCKTSEHWKCGNKESYSKIQGGAGEGSHGICGILGVSQKDTTEGPLWRETLVRSLGSYDTVELVGGMCHGNGCRQETTRLNAIYCTDTGWSSLTHNRMRHQALARSLRASEVQFVVENC